jgi:hypothetical protein
MGGLLFLAFNNPNKADFEEINARTINLVEKDGRIRLVIANTKRSPGAVINDRLLYESGGRPGMIFFNEDGDECGGLIYSVRKIDGKYRASGILTFDRYDQDQVVGLQYSESEGKYVKARLTIWDRPETPITDFVDKKTAVDKLEGEKKIKALEEFRAAIKRGDFGSMRLFLGSRNKTSMVVLKDTQNRDRLKLYVDPDGKSALILLDENGDIIYRIPPEQ